MKELLHAIIGLTMEKLVFTYDDYAEENGSDPADMFIEPQLEVLRRKNRKT